MDEWKIEKYWKCVSCLSMALLVMLLLFLACWAPIHILNIIEDFGVPVCCSCCSKGVLVHLRLLTFNTIIMIRCTVGLTTTSHSFWLTSSQWPPRARIQFSMAGSMGRFPKRNFRTFLKLKFCEKDFANSWKWVFLGTDYSSQLVKFTFPEVQYRKRTESGLVQTLVRSNTKRKWWEIVVWLAPPIHYSALNIHWVFVNRDTTMPFPILRQ